MKILMIANNAMAIPVLQMLAEHSLLAGLAHAQLKEYDAHALHGFCKAREIPVMQLARTTLSVQLYNYIQDNHVDLCVVFTFPWLIPEDVLAIPRYGFLNIHPGLLPEMRGADPVFEAIRGQYATTGLTIHRMFGGFDAGNIVSRHALPLQKNITYGMLTRSMAILAALKLQEVLQQIQAGEGIPETPQNPEHARYFEKVTAHQLHPDPAVMPAAEFFALVKACNPVVRNGIPVTINGITIGVCNVSDVTLSGDASAFAAGSILAVDKTNGFIVLFADKKAVNIDVVYTEDGYMPGHHLEMYGIRPGMIVEKMNADKN